LWLYEKLKEHTTLDEFHDNIKVLFVLESTIAFGCKLSQISGQGLQDLLFSLDMLYLLAPHDVFLDQTL
jgi:hypothetical protein